MKNARRLYANAVVILIGASVNFFVFLESYKRLAFPYINEEQRVENAPFIVFNILPVFIGAAIAMFFVHKMLFRFSAKSC